MATVTISPPMAHTADKISEAPMADAASQKKPAKQMARVSSLRGVSQNIVRFIS